MIWFYLTSGLFLGWSLGANDAANVFGTAVATRMVRFTTAAWIASLFVILGAVIGGAGPAATYGKLGAINAMGGAFTVALSAALVVAWMVRLGLPVSTTQAIVGAIVGWDLFAHRPVPFGTLSKIMITWVASPLLAAGFAFLLNHLIRRMLPYLRLHLLMQDLLNRIILVLIGAFGAYSLGANNIANVMGVFVTSNPFQDLYVQSFRLLSGLQVLFLLGGVAIATGIFTYSQKVMMTVGRELFRLSPVDAWVVVLAESMVLFLFSSHHLQQWLVGHHLPAPPLVPVSSSQAVVGAVIGIGFARGGIRAIRYEVLGQIALGWVFTPAAGGLIAFLLLFVMQNVFQQTVMLP